MTDTLDYSDSMRALRWRWLNEESEHKDGTPVQLSFASAGTASPPPGSVQMVTPTEFSIIVSGFFTDARKMLDEKNAQYAQGDDPLANFRETAKFLNTGMLEALAPHLHKHYRSLMSRLVVSDHDEAREHCIDIVNYLAFIMVIKTELARRKEST